MQQISEDSDVDRCVCFQTTFLTLKKIAARHNVTQLEQLFEHAEFGLACHMCHPYVRRMLETGETQFAVMSHEEMGEVDDD